MSSGSRFSKDKGLSERIVVRPYAANQTVALHNFFHYLIHGQSLSTVLANDEALQLTNSNR